MISASTLQALQGPHIDPAGPRQAPPEITIIDGDGRRVATATALRRVGSDVYEVLVGDAVMGQISGPEAAARAFGLPILEVLGQALRLLGGPHAAP